MRWEESSADFALVLHPVNPKRDVGRKYPRLAPILPGALIELLSRIWPPVVLSHVTGICSEATGKRIEGWLLASPLTSRQMAEWPPLAVYDRIVRAGRLGQTRGARILGLGGMGGMLADRGVTVAQRLNMPVTTGDTLTVAVAIAVLRGAAEDRGLPLKDATAAVVGASGGIGLACAEVLAPHVAELVVVGRREIGVSQARAEVEAAGGARVRMSTEIDAVLAADVIVAAAGAPRPLIRSHHLKPGAIVCDLARPPNVSGEVEREREDVSLIGGGILHVPGHADFGIDLGLRTGLAYACMAEVMLLALEGRYESYSLGQRIQRDRVREIGELARKHGFRVSPTGRERMI